MHEAWMHIQYLECWFLREFGRRKFSSKKSSIAVCAGNTAPIRDTACHIGRIPRHRHPREDAGEDVGVVECGLV